MVDCCPKAEFVEYDEAISAPERDTDATAFELDPSCLAPQVRKWVFIGGGIGSDYMHRFYLAQRLSCPTETRYPNFTAGGRPP